ncbi:unnamed protein product [Coregonus sp. 'balchen']|nr:unnamed protein product [Coregonus sp. 'balchen']
MRPKQSVPPGEITFYSLNEALNKRASSPTLALINASIEPLSQEEWELVKEVCAVLQPFQEVTVEISADSYVTASKMLLLCKGLQLGDSREPMDMIVELLMKLFRGLVQQQQQNAPPAASQLHHYRAKWRRSSKPLLFGGFLMTELQEMLQGEIRQLML